MKIPGIKTRVKSSAAKLFEMTSNCQNFVAYFPDQVKDVSVTENSCSFITANTIPYSSKHNHLTTNLLQIPFTTNLY